MLEPHDIAVMHRDRDGHNSGRGHSQEGDEGVGAHELQPQQPVGGAVQRHEVRVDDCADMHTQRQVRRSGHTALDLT